ECGSGDCTASCNTPFPKAGVCVCQEDAHCGVDAYCSDGLLSTAQCIDKKDDCTSCDNNFECAADFCDEGFLGTGGKCSSQASLDVGASCCKDSQCVSANCENAECVGCTADEECGDGQTCTNNACKGLKPIGEACSDSSQCETGSCSGGQCACTEDAQCGAGNWCDTSFLGQNQCVELLGECAACGDDTECVSGMCEGLFSPASNKCVTENQLALEAACCKDSQCLSGQCAGNDDDQVVCQCSEDSDCPSGQTCNTSLFGANVCE
ncbi:MAG: Cys-rich repeat protein, partial [Myxococcota bacterium]